MKLVILLLSVLVYTDLSGARILSQRTIQSKPTFCNWYIKTLEKYSSEEFSALQKAFRNESEHTAALWAFVAGIQTVPACYNRKLIACLKDKYADPHEAVSSPIKLPTKNILYLTEKSEPTATIELRAGDTLEDFITILNALYESSNQDYTKEKCKLQLIRSLFFPTSSSVRKTRSLKSPS